MKRSRIIWMFPVTVLFLLAACGEVNYCVQCVSGQWDVMSRSRPIAEVLQDPSVSEAERVQLAKVLAIRDFAVTELALPDNDSYRIYANLGRPYVVWNVVATPEFSLSPRQWCYPVVGCVAYRGYFSEDEAKALGTELAAQGFDVDVYGVKAYSTLKWFDDPVLNTFIDGPDSQLASLIFHELAHQVVYVADDCAFNEAFAKAVETEGLRRWLQKHSSDGEWRDYQDREVRGQEFLAALNRTRGELATLYAQPLAEDAKRLAKQQVMTRLDSELRDLGRSWNNPAAIEAWLKRGLNNARLTSIATYHDRVPAFQGLLQAHNGNLPDFYAAVAGLASLPAAERLARLKEYGPIEVAAACKDEPGSVHR